MPRARHSRDTKTTVANSRLTVLYGKTRYSLREPSPTKSGFEGENKTTLANRNVEKT